MSRVAVASRRRVVSPVGALAVSMAAVAWGGAAFAQAPAPRVFVPVQPPILAAPKVQVPVQPNPVLTAPVMKISPTVAPMPIITPSVATTVAPTIVKDAAILTPSKPADTGQQTTAVLVKGQGSSGSTSDGASKDSGNKEATRFDAGCLVATTACIPGRSGEFPTEEATKPDKGKPDKGSEPPPPPVVKKPDLPPRLPVVPAPPLPGTISPALTRLAAVQTLYLPKPTTCEVAELPDPRRRPVDDRRR